MHDSLMAWLPNSLGCVFAENRAPVAKHERQWGGAAFYNIYDTLDERYIVLGAQEIKFVRTLLEALGRLDLAVLAERGPGPHQLPLTTFLRGVFAQRTQAQWVEWFQGRDIAFAPVKDLREALADPQLAARSMVLLDAAGHRHLGIPIKFSNEPGTHGSPSLPSANIRQPFWRKSAVNPKLRKRQAAAPAHDSNTFPRLYSKIEASCPH